jgi:D-aminopeptidase
MGKPRARDLGLRFPGTPGKFNAITDVPGVEVGFSTLKSLATNDHPQIYTGVTAPTLRRCGLDSRSTVSIFNL